jgi:hypothetical protein
MGDILQVPLNLKHVSQRESPVIISEFIETRDSIARNARGCVDIGIEVTHHQIANTSKHRLASVQPNVPRTSDGPNTPAPFEQKQNMIEFVL